MNDIVEKKILIINICKYGSDSSHISYIDLSSDSCLVRDKFKGYVIKELYCGSQPIFDSITNENLLSPFTIRYVPGRRWNSAEVLQLQIDNDVIYKSKK